MRYVVTIDKPPTPSPALFEWVSRVSTNMGVRDEKEWFRDIRDRSYSAVEAEMKDARAERPFDLGLIDRMRSEAEAREAASCLATPSF